MKKSGTIRTRRKPHETAVQAISRHLQNDPEKALRQAESLLKTAPKHGALLALAATAAHVCGKKSQALSYTARALELEPNNAQALQVRSMLETEKSNHGEALSLLKRAETANPNDILTLRLLSRCHLRVRNYEDFFSSFRRLNELKGVDSGELTNLSKALIETGRIEEALKTLDEVLKKDPANEDTYKNRIVTLHYHPRYSAEEILQECSRMQERFRPTEPVIRARAQDLSPGKKIRIGMFSEGFRAHPVGHMITLALAHVPRHEIEFFFYGTNARSDHITKRLKTICSTWREAQGLSEEALNHLIRADHIDILFDLSGYNAGSRMRTVMLEPAPIIIKWVGGLISSTGLDAVDYLLSDRVETPVDADRLYTEKLIRLPDDYICYEPPDYLPPIKELPAARRGYVTFGCFNNASKINEDLLEHWARILRTVKDSRLFLKSYGFSTGKLRSDIERFFAERGISAHRLTLEGPAPHRELLACYNDIDIALDPWPYSGGLCTCEALIMGVPVVTLPGPTFAGRHSATHLVNAGLPELVAQNWDHYHMLATGLANDLENLSVIRQNLRLTVLKSPLCDAERFGRSFSNAMRAVWQRHCAGKTPEALVLSDDQTPYFADESGPVELILPMPETEVPPCYQRGGRAQYSPEAFCFSPTGRIVAIDNGTNLTASPKFSELRATGAFDFILLDPAGLIDKQALTLGADRSVQLLPFHTLGNGEKTSLHACIDPAMSSTLPPLCSAKEKSSGDFVIAEIPVFTITANAIGGLTHIDWLLMNGRHAVVPLLSPDNSLMKQALVIQVNLPVGLHYEGQPDINSLVLHMEGIGFQFYRIQGAAYHDYLSGFTGDTRDVSPTHAKEYALLFVPKEDRLKLLPREEREKLAFILHSAYELNDFVFHILQMDSPVRATQYLKSVVSISGDQLPHRDPAAFINDTAPDISITYEIPDTPAMSEAETTLLKSYLKRCRGYFEFGTGGSSKLAASLGLLVSGIESDKDWLNQLKNDIGPQNFKYVDIGPTREWGYPVDRSAEIRFPLYSAAIHDFKGSYDFILVDGRFRVACALQSAKHIIDRRLEKSAVIFIHDFWGRDYYLPVLKFLDEVESVDTAAVFQVKADIRLSDLIDTINKFKNDFR